MRLKLILDNVFIFFVLIFAVLYFLRGRRDEPTSVSDPYTHHQYSVKGLSDGLQHYSSIHHHHNPGAQIFAALQVCKSPASFQARISQLRQSDGRVASYLARTRPLSLAFSRLTSMSDTEVGTRHRQSHKISPVRNTRNDIFYLFF